MSRKGRKAAPALPVAKLKWWGRFAPHRETRPLLQGCVCVRKPRTGNRRGFLLYCYPTFIGNSSVTDYAQARGERKQS